MNNGCSNLLLVALASGFIKVESVSAFQESALRLHQLWAMRSPAFPPVGCTVDHIKEPICWEKCCTCLKAVKFDGWQNAPI